MAFEASVADNIIEELWFGTEDPNHSNEVAAASMAAATAKAVGLKPFPAVAQHCLALLSEPDVDMRKLHETMEKDPVLASQLLRLANSAMFRPVRPYTSLEQAIVRLGTQTVQELVASVAMFRLFQDVDGVGATVRDHCAASAAIVRVLGTEARYRGVGKTFLATLMHDVGKLMMMQVGEFHYEGLTEEQLGEADSVHLLEREALGYDHAVLGAHVLDAWHLPEELSRAVAWHHQPGRAYEDEQQATVIAYLRVADQLEYQMRKSRELDDAFIERLADHGANAYVGYSADVYRGLWPKLVDASDDVLGATTAEPKKQPPALPRKAAGGRGARR